MDRHGTKERRTQGVRTMRMPRTRAQGWIALAWLAVVLGCSGPHGEIRGKAPAGAIATAAMLRQAPPRATVTVHGTMVEKCPVAGCWFILQDGTGRVRIDLKSAGFVVTDLPLGREVTVSGRLHRASGGAGSADPEVVATGARFE
jgi:uncharacterized protein YdeI (BOF family)